MENIYKEIKVIRHNITRFIAGYLAQKKKKFHWVIKNIYIILIFYVLVGIFFFFLNLLVNMDFIGCE